MQRGEIFAVMTCGLAGVAGTVMVIYATVLAPAVPNALGAILAASVVSTPAALAVAALMVPFGPGSGSPAAIAVADPPANALDALVRGTADGVGPLVGITTTLLVTLALVSLVNAALATLPLETPVTLQAIAALPFRPVMWLIGLSWAESGPAALLMGTKTVVNEFASYLALAALPPEALGPRSRVVMVYAMCGFANLGSVGILVGGMAAMVPERRHEVASLGMRALLSGTISTCLSGALVGLFA